MSLSTRKPWTAPGAKWTKAPQRPSGKANVRGRQTALPRSHRGTRRRRDAGAAAQSRRSARFRRSRQRRRPSCRRWRGSGCVFCQSAAVRLGRARERRRRGLGPDPPSWPWMSLLERPFWMTDDHPASGFDQKEIIARAGWRQCSGCDTLLSGECSEWQVHVAPAPAPCPSRDPKRDTRPLPALRKGGEGVGGCGACSVSHRLLTPHT